MFFLLLLFFHTKYQAKLLSLEAVLSVLAEGFCQGSQEGQLVLQNNSKTLFYGMYSKLCNRDICFVDNNIHLGFDALRV